MVSQLKEEPMDIQGYDIHIDEVLERCIWQVLNSL